MKIVQVVPYFFPAWSYGGPAKLVYDMSTYFSQQGHQVTVLTSNAFDTQGVMPESKKIYSAKNLKVVYYSLLSNWLASKTKVYITPSFYFNFFSYLRQAEIVHLHDFFTLQNAFVALICWTLNKPYIVSPHGTLQDKAVFQKTWFKKTFMNLVGYRVLKKARRVLVSSQEESRVMVKLGVDKNKIIQIGHGVNISEVTSKIGKSQSRRKLQLPQQKIIVTFLGRLSQLKGLDMLLKIIESSQNNDVYFVIAGSDDGYLETIKNSKSKNFKLMGVCFGEEKAMLFRASDIFIYPSYSEGFSVGILEAAGAGLPLIITQGCNFDQVQQAEAGLVVEANLKSLKSALTKLTADQRLRQKMSTNARHLIENKFSTKIINHQLLDIYGNCLTN